MILQQNFSEMAVLLACSYAMKRGRELGREEADLGAEGFR